jgi:hypothetical protein
MKTMILAAAAVVALGMGTAFAEGEGGPTAGGLEWQAANGNPTIPATEWFAMTPAAREARVQQLQQQAPLPYGQALRRMATRLPRAMQTRMADRCR